MADVRQAVQLVTDPANVTRMGVTGPDQQFAVNQNRVLRGLRNAGAGKAEARELALKALEEAGGGAEIRASRGTPATGGRGEAEAEHWWVPASAVRFED
ncbi:MAG: hypothetical protein M3383_04265 [Actinomycetota bacterium]|nr:hypothetical protein [Actinomycetota bacterium]